jgi:8-amino-7-oxononanoate synthase
MYEKELKAIRKSNRFREREIFDESLVDLASNDYLGFSEDKELFEKAVCRVRKFKTHAPKASQLVNGYHQIHKEFEEYLCAINGFEDGIVVGSGFLANLSLIEALVRRDDLLVLDELYHASGILASKLVEGRVVKFAHNDAKELKHILETYKYNRAIVCVEGIYSMDGDVLNRDIFKIVTEKNQLLIVDEAHSSGVLGDNLLGVYEHFNIDIKPNHIKMGTLGKAYGSYGAFILAESEIISFLQNRAKAIIYATAPSVFDIALSFESVLKSQLDKERLGVKKDKIQKIVYDVFGLKLDGLILKLDVKDSKKALELKEFAKSRGFLIGAIRPPTVKRAIIRLIPRLSVECEVLEKFLRELKDAI